MTEHPGADDRRQALLDDLRGFTREFGEPPRTIDFGNVHRDCPVHGWRYDRYKARGWASFLSYFKVFGSWNAALVDAGLPVRQRTRTTREIEEHS